MHLNTAVVLGFLLTSTTTTDTPAISPPAVESSSPQPPRLNGVERIIHAATNSTSAFRSAINASGAGARSDENVDKGIAAAAVDIAILGLMASNNSKDSTSSWSVAVLGGAISGVVLMLGVGDWGENEELGMGYERMEKA